MMVKFGSRNISVLYIVQIYIHTLCIHVEKAEILALSLSLGTYEI
jgi:hypothetical protein